MTVIRLDPVGRFLDEMVEVYDDWIAREIKETPNLHSAKFDFLMRTPAGHIIHQTPALQFANRMVILWSRNIFETYHPIKSQLSLLGEEGEKLVEWIDESSDLAEGTTTTIKEFRTSVKPLVPIQLEKILNQKLAQKPLDPSNGLPKLTPAEIDVFVLEQDATGKARALHRRTCGLFSAVDLAREPPPHMTRLTALRCFLGCIVAALPICIYAYQLSQGEDPFKVINNFSRERIIGALTPNFSAAIFVGGIGWILS